MPYTRAIVPAVGDPVTSRVVRSVTRAMGDRMKLGPSLGWRLVDLLQSAFTQIRNADASRFLYPPEAEFMYFYQMLDPQQAQWPEAGPGDPEGINIASQWGNFVFGAEAIGVPGEDERLSNGEFLIAAANQQPETLWRLAQRQRGAVDPRTGAMGAPALQAAGSHAYLRQSPSSRSGGFAFGGYLPGPEYLGQCAAPNERKASQVLIFTKLGDTPTTLTFGTCPEIPDSAAGVANTPFLYAVFKYDGTVVVLPKTQWIEGPYTSEPSPRKTANGMVQFGLNQFIADFRGTAEQRAEGGWNEHAFATQEVLTTQYHLAPQRGSEVGKDRSVTALYPRFRLRPAAGRVAAGTKLALAQGGTGAAYPIAAGFVCASAFVKAQGLEAPVTVSLARDGEELGTAEMTPDADGKAAAIVTWFRPQAGGRITATVVGTTAFGGATRELSVEITELLEFKPDFNTLYLILRCGGVKFNNTLDGSGTDCSFAPEISTKYLTQGVITSLENHQALPGSLAAINSNAVFDAARRLSQCVRIMPREQFTGIAVQGGKTILWFNRWAKGSRTDVRVDLFRGLAPSPDPIPSGQLVWGRRYRVATAPVTYNTSSLR